MAGHAIITGGSSGIGLAFAAQLAREGLAISLISRSAAKLAAAEAYLRAHNQHVAVRSYPADVRNESALVEAVNQAVADYGSPTWVVASAGIVEPGLFTQQTSATCVAQMETNYLGALFLAKATVPLMASSGGHLVFIGSGAAFAGIYGYASYGASKFALRGLAESLRVELMVQGIVVTLVSPGDTDTAQLAHDVARRPAVTQVIAGHDVRQAAEIANTSIERARRGKFHVTFGVRLHALAWLHSLIGEPFRRYQLRTVRRLAGPP